MNRLTKAKFGFFTTSWQTTDRYNLRDVFYHKNGNITGLKRYGHTGMLKDDLVYTYYNNTNRLRRVQDSISNTDYDDVHPQPANNYVYDSNGNMIQDTIHKVGFVIYDIFNQPVTVYTTDGNEHLYYYDHQGSRVRKRIGGSSDYYINGVDGRTEAITNFNGAWATYNLYGLDAIGQIRRSGSTWKRFYFLKDHLGSVRVTVNTSGNVVSYDDYYPFGALMWGRTQESSAVDGRYKYTGKERDTETKYDYFGARYYDARIGRFLSVDPLSDDERLIGWSPYHYGYNSPIVYIDPNGMRPQFEEDDEEDDKKVNEVSDADDDTESDTTIQNEKEKIVKSASVLLTVAGTSFYIQQKYVKKILKFMQEQQDVLRKHKLESLKNAKIMAQANKHKNIIRWATKASPIASGLLSYFEFSQNKDPVQLTINMSIIGITIVKPPLGLALGVLDHTIGIKRIGNAHIETQMKILEYNEGRPPAGLGRR